jgi:hypothetical protein
VTTCPHMTGSTCSVCEELAAVKTRLTALLEVAKQAQCRCRVSERDSGHVVGCWMPALLEAIERAEAK